MTRESRDPLSVLRGVDSACLSRRLTAAECGELHEAIAQVEALAEAHADLLLTIRNVDRYIYGEGDSDDIEQYEGALSRADDAIKPFTPTDSEGGGHARS